MNDWYELPTMFLGIQVRETELGMGVVCRQYDPRPHYSASLRYHSGDYLSNPYFDTLEDAKAWVEDHLILRERAVGEPY